MMSKAPNGSNGKSDTLGTYSPRSDSLSARIVALIDRWCGADQPIDYIAFRRTTKAYARSFVLFLAICAAVVYASAAAPRGAAAVSFIGGAVFAIYARNVMLLVLIWVPFMWADGSDAAAAMGVLMAFIATAVFAFKRMQLGRRPVVDFAGKPLKHSDFRGGYSWGIGELVAKPAWFVIRAICKPIFWLLELALIAVPIFIIIFIISSFLGRWNFGLGGSTFWWIVMVEILLIMLLVD
jgi:hypothetical protein